jgi:hypothetical protein
MVEDVVSSIILVLVVFMGSVLIVPFFTEYEWNEFAQSGKMVAVAVKDSVNNNEKSENIVEQSEEGRVLGVQSIRPVDFVDYPVVHISTGERNVFESPPSE